MERVLLLYKKIGETPLGCLNRFKCSRSEYKNISMTYAGRLDPMAEGLLLILAGEEVYKKEEYLGLPKTYEFEVLWGFETDTSDALGLVTNTSQKHPEDKSIQIALPKSIGKKIQTYPAFSSKTVAGKPLFAWAREGEIESIEIPKREVEIYNLVFKNTREILGEKLLDEMFSAIDSVEGDFRQVEIKERWKRVLIIDKKYYISSFKIECSSGTYVRSLAQELGQRFESNAIAFHIKRLKIGSFSLHEEV